MSASSFVPFGRNGNNRKFNSDVSFSLKVKRRIVFYKRSMTPDGGQFWQKF
jgi:hypothetical protein